MEKMVKLEIFANRKSLCLCYLNWIDAPAAAVVVSQFFYHHFDVVNLHCTFILFCWQMLHKWVDSSRVNSLAAAMLFVSNM